jgi:monothiol glutaredoxin
VTRPQLSTSQLSEPALQKIEGFHAEVIARVSEAIRTHAIVVVGMAQNPHVKRARKLLEAAGHAFEYVEYGSYLSAWRERLAIKMWSGWPTFPQVFVDGTLLGGADQLDRALADGSVRRLLDARSAAA